MSNFTDWMAEKLQRLGVAGKCAVCGNTALDELAMSLRGQLHCRQDVAAIREGCRKRVGWRVIDGGGRVLNTGSGVTLRVAGDLDGLGN
jgi:hypothetical protein